jgi:DNA-directed RNA polymerase specialized sigma24 family protein
MRCRNRDKSAFEELVRPYLQRAYSTSLGILKSQDLAEDAVQNALIVNLHIKTDGIFHFILATLSV